MSENKLVNETAITCLALGNFDGIHVGHQKLIKEAKRISLKKNSICSIMTFAPHPKAVIGQNDNYNNLITPWETKLDILHELGVEQIFLVEFNYDFASVLPSDFVSRYINSANAIDVVIGEDFRYGYRGQGNPSTLESDGKLHGFNVTTIPSLMCGIEKVSSSLIRQLLNKGDVLEVSRLLNRPFQIRGIVVDGEKRGRQLGYPTANVELSDKYLLPINGVYIVRVIVDSEQLLGVMNIGYKPTFIEDVIEPTIEIHLLDFNKDIYGNYLSIDILDYIRAETKFDNKDALIEQIKQDINVARLVFPKYCELLS
jgi:riboflavin kinase/FMN adenylyltransferase